MEFAKLAQTFEELERTSSRLKLIELLTALFRSVGTPEENEQVCYLVQGRVAPFFEPLEMGMAEKTTARSIATATHITPEQVFSRYRALGDMGLVAELEQKEAGTVPERLSVNEVFLRLRELTQVTGKGAIEQRIAQLASVLLRADGISAKYIVRIVLGNLRLGIGDATVLDALAKARWNDTKKRKLLEGAYNRTSDLGLIARTIFEHPHEEEAEKAVATLSVQVGKPIRSQLAERLPDAETIIARMGTVVAQYKFDGFRVSGFQVN